MVQLKKYFERDTSCRMFFKPRYKFGEITKRWGDANFKKDFDKILDDWLNQFSKEEKPVLLELLRNFYYYTETAVNQKVVELHNKFLNANGNDISNVVFTKIPKEFGVANSDVIFNSYWLNNEIKDSCCNDVVRELLENDVVPKTLVIIDDYVGSGNNIIGELKRMFSIAPELQNSKLYFLVLHATNVGIIALEDFTKNLGLDLTLIYLDNTKKAFQDDYIFKKIDARIKQDEYTQICNKKDVGKSVILGYNDVQSLVSFSKTTPNDTLGLFWHSADNFVALFKKTKRQRNTSISKMKNVARRNEHRDRVLFNIEDNQYNKLIVYCVVNGNNFSFEQACEDFGMTPDILGNKLRYIEKKGYIKIENGKLLPTAETEANIIKSRLKGWKQAEKELEKENKISLIQTTYIPKNFSESFSGYKK